MSQIKGCLYGVAAAAVAAHPDLPEQSDIWIWQDIENMMENVRDLSENGMRKTGRVDLSKPFPISSLIGLLPVAFSYYLQYGKNWMEMQPCQQEFMRIAGAHRAATQIQSAIYAVIASQLMAGVMVRAAIRKGIKQGTRICTCLERERAIKKRYEIIAAPSFLPQADGQDAAADDMLNGALWSLLHGRNYEDCVQKAKTFGFSAAVLAGGLAGIACGDGSIPDCWRKQISEEMELERYCRLLERFCETHGTYKLVQVYGMDAFSAIVLPRGGARKIASKYLEEKVYSRYLGCMLGMALGDALGYAQEQYQEVDVQDAPLLLSDDTQLALFFAEGLLLAIEDGKQRGVMAPHVNDLYQSARRWLFTQQHEHPPARQEYFQYGLGAPGGLLGVSQMYHRRSPQQSCLDLLKVGHPATLEEAREEISNASHFIAPVVPVGLFFGNTGYSLEESSKIGAEAAALLSHIQLAHVSARMLSYIVRRLSCRTASSVLDAVLDAQENVLQNVSDTAVLRRITRKVNCAAALVEQGIDDRTAIEYLEQDRHSGDSYAFAVAVYCSLKYAEDWVQGVRAAVRYSNVSSSAGAMTGAILGAYLGDAAIPEIYQNRLELREIIVQLAEALYLLPGLQR